MQAINHSYCYCACDGWMRLRNRFRPNSVLLHTCMAGPLSLHKHRTCHALSRRRQPAAGVRCWFSKQQHQHTQVRVLRYPSGETRYIRYPVDATVDLDEEEPNESVAAWDVSGLWGVNARAGGHARPQVKSLHKPQLQPSKPQPSFQETAAYLEGLFAASYEAQPLVDVDHCYQVLHGCPWVLPRPVFVLACRSPGATAGDDIRNTYTLRTKVKQEGAADALAQLLNKQHLSDVLEVSEMRDGVVAFEAAADADRFAGKLEEEGHSQVMIAEVDSHKLFRMASDVRALVVLLQGGADIPAPYQLAASLKKKTSWDSL